VESTQIKSSTPVMANQTVITALCLSSVLLLTGCTNNESPNAEKGGTGFYSTRMEICEWLVSCTIMYAEPGRNRAACLMAIPFIRSATQDRYPPYVSLKVTCVEVDPYQVLSSTE
jgi:hypothetical protein